MAGEKDWSEEEDWEAASATAETRVAGGEEGCWGAAGSARWEVAERAVAAWWVVAEAGLEGKIPA